ncbi:MAG: Two-component response regulator [Labilithrix sp.]|nr:Two-component response regulator [Labilithrix sp.]
MAEILIVEDDADLAATLGELFQFEGHTTRVAFNGEEGLRAMDEHLPDLILLDIEMPVLDGPGMAYAAIAKDAGRECIPVILSSGYADIEAIADGLGTQYRIAKPCSLEKLRSLVRRALEEKDPPHQKRAMTEGARP